jgi:PST family polysaccharide transporter/lipopolysaccharide exporter
VLWVLLTFTTPIALFVAIAAPDLVPLLYGEKWLPSVPILQMLAAFAVLRPLWDDLISVLVATKRLGKMARLVFAQAMALVVFATPLTWFFGAVGTAFGVGVAFLISGGFLIYFGYRHFSVRISENVALPLFNNLFALAIYLVFRIFFSFDSFAPVTRILIAGMLFGVLYFGISILTSRQMIFRRARYVVQLVRG